MKVTGDWPPVPAYEHTEATSKLRYQSAQQVTPQNEVPISPAVKIDPVVKAIKLTEKSEKPKKKLICYMCGEPVAYNVAKFCWFNKLKFGENIYCMDCQKKV